MTFREKKPVVLFVPSLKFGGAERVAILLANQAVQENRSTSVCTFVAGGEFSCKLDDRVKKVIIGRKQSPLSILKWFFYIFRSKPSIIISILNDANVYSLLYRLLFPFTKHVFVISEHSPLTRNLERKPFRLAFSAWLYLKADRIVTVSTFVKSDLSRVLKRRKKIQVINNPIDHKELAWRAKESCFFNFDKFNVVIVGRLVPVKRVEDLIKAVALLRAEGCSGYSAHIIGDGPVRTELELLVANYGLSEDIVFHGFQSNPYRFVARANLLVCSSEWEGFGYAIFESISLGTPVLLSDALSAPVELLKENRGALTYKAGSPRDLACKLKVARAAEGGHVGLLPKSFLIEEVLASYLGIRE